MIKRYERKIVKGYKAMERIVSTPREDHLNIVHSQGLIYSKSILENNESYYYWNENSYYSFKEEEIDLIENTTRKLHDMSIEAVEFLIEENKKKESPWKCLNIPEYSIEYAEESFKRDDPTLYGRFDLLYNGDDNPKMLEYNGDTPTGLIETSICQLKWIQEVFPQKGQYNMLHDALIERWKEILSNTKINSIHFAHTAEDPTGEDLMNTAYLRDCAEQAGWNTYGVEMSDIGINENGEFLGLFDEKIENIFKLYPWEDLFHEEYGEIISLLKTQGWIEPAWKTFISTKILLAALWHIYPNNELLLPAYVNNPNGMKEYVQKPLWGREGDNIILHTDSHHIEREGRYGDEGYVYQQYKEIKNFPGEDFKNNHPIIGSWIVGEDPVGIGIRESDGPITDFYCRFVPHIIE